ERAYGDLLRLSKYLNEDEWNSPALISAWKLCIKPNQGDYEFYEHWIHAPSCLKIQSTLRKRKRQEDAKAARETSIRTFHPDEVKRIPVRVMKTSTGAIYHTPLIESDGAQNNSPSPIFAGTVYVPTYPLFGPGVSNLFGAEKVSEFVGSVSGSVSIGAFIAEAGFAATAIEVMELIFDARTSKILDLVQEDPDTFEGYTIMTITSDQTGNSDKTIEREVLGRLGAKVASVPDPENMPHMPRKNGRSLKQKWREAKWKAQNTPHQKNKTWSDYFRSVRDFFRRARSAEKGSLGKWWRARQNAATLSKMESSKFPRASKEGYLSFRFRRLKTSFGETFDGMLEHWAKLRESYIRIIPRSPGQAVRIVGQTINRPRALARAISEIYAWASLGNALKNINFFPKRTNPLGYDLIEPLIPEDQREDFEYGMGAFGAASIGGALGHILGGVNYAASFALNVGYAIGHAWFQEKSGGTDKANIDWNKTICSTAVGAAITGFVYTGLYRGITGSVKNISWWHEAVPAIERKFPLLGKLLRIIPAEIQPQRISKVAALVEYNSFKLAWNLSTSIFWAKADNSNVDKLREFFSVRAVFADPVLSFIRMTWNITQNPYASFGYAIASSYMGSELSQYIPLWEGKEYFYNLFTENYAKDILPKYRLVDELTGSFTNSLCSAQFDIKSEFPYVSTSKDYPWLLSKSAYPELTAQDWYDLTKMLYDGRFDNGNSSTQTLVENLYSLATVPDVDAAYDRVKVGIFMVLATYSSSPRESFLRTKPFTSDERKRMRLLKAKMEDILGKTNYRKLTAHNKQEFFDRIEAINNGEFDQFISATNLAQNE
ncbi:hypothetical protein KKA47_00570, partial [bacterium]|nr:hypothetical protein [bacterium]